MTTYILFKINLVNYVLCTVFLGNNIPAKVWLELVLSLVEFLPLKGEEVRTKKFNLKQFLPILQLQQHVVCRTDGG